MSRTDGGEAAMRPSTRQRLIETAREVLALAAAGRFRTEDAPLRLEAAEYTDDARFRLELGQLFRRVPLLLAASCELAAPGAYKTVEVAGVPVLLTRDREHRVRALLNACTHRGSIVASGAGQATRFVCPYHGWTFANDGALIGIASAADFGALDRSCHGLRALPTLERHGLIWAVLDPQSTLDIDAFLGDFGDALAGFDFAGWRLVEQRRLAGANWKLAFDAHLEFYHLPVLHRATFGPQTSNRALYFFDGPHARLLRPVDAPGVSLPARTDIGRLRGLAEEDWPMDALLSGEWIMFPNVSINSFNDGGRGVLISQVFPGERVGESVTVQSYYLQDDPDDEALAAAKRRCEFLAHVVNDEDLANSFAQQRALASGLLEEVVIGANEGGVQRFHQWLAAVLAADGAELDSLFAANRRSDSSSD